MSVLFPNMWLSENVLSVHSSSSHTSFSVLSLGHRCCPPVIKACAWSWHWFWPMEYEQTWTMPHPTFVPHSMILNSMSRCWETFGQSVLILCKDIMTKKLTNLFHIDFQMRTTCIQSKQQNRLALEFLQLSTQNSNQHILYLKFIPFSF